MTNTKGIRRGTRYMFSRKFRTKGAIPLSTYFKTYRRGDIVDIKGNGAIQKGMPHKIYHGKTGRVYNVTPHAVGIIVNKRVRGRIIAKRINVRIEHIRHSACRVDFLNRVHENEKIKNEAKEKGEAPPHCKRQPKKPREAHTVRTRYNKPQTIQPIPYEFIA
ncbi:60S ribosomal protein L21 [Lingula anatina]|uniref:Large ribosomal subunit protein eL21 n=1 Tax=Lingula anatina TaxID=7574 RepID=A0A1S3I882_LINAN|nr:60S ribosomal protein L21-like [Lingula anatina]XP_013404344.1 60S ribosomal protein L21 [Lingula anatina]|eukprot:XP_013394467.1 60S ribosomal protein L21-like [Lingula anatina]